MRDIDSAFSRLDLTDEQEEQLEELQKSQREEFYKWRQERRKARESILTQEQREKLKAMKDEAFYGG